MPDRKHFALPSKLALTIASILVLQMAAMFGISMSERALAPPELHTLPADIAGWKMTGEQSLEPTVVEYLRPDDYVMRDYLRGDRRASMNLFVAYFKSLRSNYGPHSPRACLPGSGWLTRSLTTMTLTVPGRPEGVTVNRYVLEKGGRQILVLYWYQNDRRIWADEIQTKLHLLPDLVRYRRSDVSLVRVITSLPDSHSIDAPLEYSVEFCRALLPLLIERMAATG